MIRPDATAATPVRTRRQITSALAFIISGIVLWREIVGFAAGLTKVAPVLDERDAARPETGGAAERKIKYPQERGLTGPAPSGTEVASPPGRMF